MNRAPAPAPQGETRRMEAGPDALEPAFHCVRAHWIRGFMPFQLARHTRTVMLMVSA